MKFCFDRLLQDQIPYPNLARASAAPFTPSWRQFDQHYPQVVPLRLLMYLKWLDISYEITTVSQATVDAWYPVAFSWFNFELDYFELMPLNTLSAIKQQKFRVLFYYHEADNPYHIKQRIDFLIDKHQLPQDCYCFISANSAARNIENFLYWPEHELFFGYINRMQSIVAINQTSTYDFTVLSRWHKSWRLSVMADLHRDGLLENSLFSYDTNFVPDPHDVNPIESDSYSDWQLATQKFLQDGPYRCDEFNRQQNNDHHWVNTPLYTSSRCHIVLETHFDADGSGGTFFTEKTFKCIKFGQPFVIAGPPNSLAELRQMGYKVFDNIIDNTYDTIQDNTQRWLALKNTIRLIKQRDPLDWITHVQHDTQHNQDLFFTRNRIAIDELSKQLYQLATA